MADRLMLKFGSAIITIQKVNAYYCDSNRCSEDEYCCGINICCASYRVWGLWYFWLGLVFFLFLLTACAGFWRYRYRQNPIIISSTTLPYSPLANGSQADNLNKSSTYSDSYVSADCDSNRFYTSASNMPPPPYGAHYPEPNNHSAAPPSYITATSTYSDFGPRDQGFHQR